MIVLDTTNLTAGFSQRSVGSAFAERLMAVFGARKNTKREGSVVISDRRKIMSFSLRTESVTNLPFVTL